MKVLDLRGLTCPMPVIKLKSELEMGNGELVVLTSDPGTLSEIPALAEKLGWKVVKVEENECFKFTLKK
ncbi:SirA family protein [Ferroglobus placidus DSM 10642]|uniref:SirA family protein n=1 Tax=Ferroglobus placidus (strain DSM 10642 / AEDII12DO) TaxID=589924 RepID=D3RXN5_FERPA|nr:sulfurtransferase TusA family protein [Ferroglobus placidus]ADC65248.1 SirA family protein [Ferroglobus placidus DSM 10642]